MLNALDHAAELSSHQTTGLRTGDSKGVFRRVCIETEQLGCSGSGAGGSVYGTTMPTTGQHIVSV